MKFVPLNKSVLCEIFIPEKCEKNFNGVKYIEENLPMYRILQKNQIKEFNIGDIIVCDSTGTRIMDSGKEYRIFMKDDIVCKISK